VNSFTKPQKLRIQNAVIHLPKLDVFYQGFFKKFHLDYVLFYRPMRAWIETDQNLPSAQSFPTKSRKSGKKLLLDGHDQILDLNFGP